MRIGELLTFCWRGTTAASHISELRLRQEIANIPVANGFPTTRTRNAYAAIHSDSLRADFNKLSARYKIGIGTGGSWCLHDYVNDNVDCSYSNRSQCAATASGGPGGVR
jgi:hypothetical protein